MHDRQQGGDAREDSTASMAEAVQHVAGLVRALEGTSTRRVHVRVGEVEITVERDMLSTAEQSPGPAPGATLGSGEPADRLTILAPLVGIFYRASSPNARPFVEVGDRVTAGQVVGIVEAMKVMNEVVSEHDGTVLEIVAANGETVHYEQPLVVLATREPAASEHSP